MPFVFVLILLFKLEIDFVKSAYIYINKYIRSRFDLDFSLQIQECIEDDINFFDYIKSKSHYNNNFSIEKYLELYRFHFPKISLSIEFKSFEISSKDLNGINS